MFLTLIIILPVSFGYLSVKKYVCVTLEKGILLLQYSCKGTSIHSISFSKYCVMCRAAAPPLFIPNEQGIHLPHISTRIYGEILGIIPAEISS